MLKSGLFQKRGEGFKNVKSNDSNPKEGARTKNWSACDRQYQTQGVLHAQEETVKENTIKSKDLMQSW